MVAVSYSTSIYLSKGPKPLQVLGAAGFWKHPISRLNQPHFLSLSSQDKWFSLSHLRDSAELQFIDNLHVLRGPEMNPVFQRQPNKCLAKRKNCFPHFLAVFLLTQPRALSLHPCQDPVGSGSTRCAPGPVPAPQGCSQPGNPNLLPAGCLSQTQSRAGVLTEFHEVYCQLISPV